MYRKEIRAGDWASPSKKQDWARYEVRRVEGDMFFVTRDCGSLVTQVPREVIVADWVRLIPEKSHGKLPPWVVEGAERLWKRWAVSGGKERIDQVPIRVSRVFPTQGWFSTFNIEDGQLFFWAAHTLHQDYTPDDFKPFVTRFNRESVI